MKCYRFVRYIKFNQICMIILFCILFIFQVYLVFLAPIHAISMVKAGRPEGLDTTTLHEVITGGSAMSRKQFLDFRDLLPGTHLSQGYGQTEVAGVITKFNFARRKDVVLGFKNPESCGRPLPGIWYKVRDIYF